MSRLRHNEDITVPMPPTEELEVRWQHDQVHGRLKEIEKLAKRMSKELDQVPRDCYPAAQDAHLEKFDRIIGLLQQTIEMIRNRQAS